MSVMSLLDIINYVGDSTRPLKEGKLLANSNLFLHFGIVPSAAVVGVCLTSKISADPHIVRIIRESLDDDESVKLKGNCTCKAGSPRCKHIVALMLKLEKLSLDQVSILSPTEITQKWGKLSKNHESAKPSRIDNLCHLKERKSNYKAVPKELPTDVNQFVFDNILAAFPNSITALALNQAKTSEPDTDTTQNPESHIMSVIEEQFTKRHQSLILEENSYYFFLNSSSQKIINFYYEHVKVCAQKAVEICRQTKFQNNDEWKRQRQIRITGSTAYSLYTYTKNKKPNWHGKLQNIVSPVFKGNQHTAFGLVKESVAKDLLAKTNPNIVQNCGLIVNPHYPWLGSSPDGFVLQNNEVILLEVKALQKGKTLEGIEFLQSLKFLRQDENNCFVMKQNHAYYAQIQMGLFLTNLKTAKLILYIHKSGSIEVIDVPFDETFVRDIVRELSNVYFNYYLPHIVEFLSVISA